tara:strand:- start:244 stop:531 length:288 start_codon:yes stop_codon:yes gene_type:complete
MSSLIKFREIKISDAKKILKWRRKTRISNFQFTDISNSLKLQKKWISESFNKMNYYHWLILFKKKPIGFFSINNINLKNQKPLGLGILGQTKTLV